MRRFDYLGLTFEPYRNLMGEEKTTFHERMSKFSLSPNHFNHSDFYAAAVAAASDNEVDLFYCEGNVILPCSDALFIYQDPQKPPHYLRTQRHTLSAESLLKVIENVGTTGFFPTPAELAEKMLSGINWDRIESVLEPSAGSGDLAKIVKKAYKEAHNSYYHTSELDLDCVEINPDLRAILRDRGYRVIHDNFLTLHTHKQYQLIVMNPPFADGERHLMRALEMIQDGGEVVCLLNAQTFRNPNTNLRKSLVQWLTDHDAVVTYYEGAFSKADRPTEVEVASVRVSIPWPDNRSSDIYEHLRAAVLEEDHTAEPNALAPSEFVENIVRQFEVEVRSGLQIMRLYQDLSPYIMRSFDKNNMLNEPILKLTVDNGPCVTNRYLMLTRIKYWEALLQRHEIMNLLTSDLSKEYQSMVAQLKDYDFTVYNVNRVLLDMRANLVGSLQQTILSLFDQLSAKHTWYPECSSNIHYYNGWASNKAHKINRKVIIPCYGLFNDLCRGDTFRLRETYQHLSDIEKVLNYLDGCMTEEVDLLNILTSANREGITKNIVCKYFNATLYKKGTVHIWFHSQRLLDTFNIYAARNRHWLPPSYGKVHYKDMAPEEQSVIDEFQGEEAYEQVMEHPEIYLVGDDILQALPEPIPAAPQ